MAEASIIPYKVKMNDTIHRIAERLLGDVAKWSDIATFNELDSPYIVNYKVEQGAKKAVGIATFYVDVSPPLGNPITIPKGVVVATELKPFFGSNRGAFQYQFETLEQQIISSGMMEVDVRVEAKEIGPDYNIFPNRLKEIFIFPLPNGSFLDLAGLGVKVRNDDAFTTGVSLKVAAPGDIIFIPVGSIETTRTSSSKIRNVTSFDDLSERVLGSDINLISDLYGVQNLGQVANDIRIRPSNGMNILAPFSPAQDISFHVGVNNLAQAVTNRLTTLRGELAAHPGYGSLIPAMIGAPGVADNVKIIALEAKNTLLADPRILGVISINVVSEGGGVYFVTAKVIVLGQDDAQTLNLVMPSKAQVA